MAKRPTAKQKNRRKMVQKRNKGIVKGIVKGISKGIVAAKKLQAKERKSK